MGLPLNNFIKSEPSHNPAQTFWAEDSDLACSSSPSTAVTVAAVRCALDLTAALSKLQWL